MPAPAVHPRPTLTFEYLCGLLEKAGLLTNEQRREAVARADVVHARLLRQRTTGPRKRAASVGDGIHPAEGLVGMGMGQAGDARFPLSEPGVMPAVAQHACVTFVDLGPVKTA